MAASAHVDEPARPADAAGAAPSHTALRRAEKYFKSRALAAQALTHKQQRLARRQVGKPSLRGRGVVDPSRAEKDEGEDEVQRAGWEVDEDRLGGRSLRRLGLRDVPGRQLAATEGYLLAEGVILIPHYLDKDAQLALLCDALAAYTRPPNPLSLDTHYALPKDAAADSLFDLYASGSDRRLPSRAELEGDRRAKPHDHSGPAGMSVDKAAAHPDATPSASAATSRELVNNPPAVQEGFESIQRRVAEWKGDEPSARLRGATAAELMRELRWCNLGHVYNWTNKAYDFAHSERIPFPAELATTCSDIIRSVPWGEALDASAYVDEEHQPDWDRWEHDYAPDTGIVNYYQLRDTLMGHVDRSELDPYRPLVSISLGHAAVFLLGGTDRDEEPIPIILRSGDVLIMAGKGRRCYHGVPRILEDTLPDHFAAATGDSAVLSACKRFISTARININARQVFPAGFVIPWE